MTYQLCLKSSKDLCKFVKWASFHLKLKHSCMRDPGGFVQQQGTCQDRVYPAVTNVGQNYLDQWFQNFVSIFWPGQNCNQMK